MRIGILTFHKAINYGAYLQSFSLSNKLKEQFPNDEVEIIDYIAPKEQRRKIYVLLRSIKHDGIRGGLSEFKRIFVFRSAQKQLSLSPKSFCTKKLNKLYSYIDERYDMLIIGSDAVFNWDQTNFPTAFIPNYSFSIPVYTYAASVHGMRFYSVSADKLQLCGDTFSSMKCVGVRDKCTEQFVRLCSDTAKTLHCCDPTLFIDKEIIYKKGITAEEKIAKKYGFSLDSKYIVIMAPDSVLTESVFKKYSGEYKIVSVFVKSSLSDYYISDLDPFEWTAVLKKASLVITSYFHGTLLSLVQGTPAVVIDYSGYCDGEYEGKLKDLMITRFNFPELYFDRSDAENFNAHEELYQKIDELINGDYSERISAAVENEKQAVKDFIEIIKPLN